MEIKWSLSSSSNRIYSTFLRKLQTMSIFFLYDSLNSVNCLFLKKKTNKTLSETAPAHTVHETGLNIFNETYFLSPLGILKWQCLWGHTSCTGLLLHQVWAEGQAVTYKLWWPGFCLWSLCVRSPICLGMAMHVLRSWLYPQPLSWFPGTHPL